MRAYTAQTVPFKHAYLAAALPLFFRSAQRVGFQRTIPPSSGKYGGNALSISSPFASATAFKKTIMNMRFHSLSLLFLIFFYVYQPIIMQIMAHSLLMQCRYHNGFRLYFSKPQVGRNPAARY